ncbi:hypothetical protein FB561_3351 [Kribbella amoyensis]|uniref:Nucleotidyltransferase AbiEii toxin of type IV toxin-antitoxin system n=1 Tax=Kribbella amoyensis TaxID=996641 RepID=A0A561BTQ9_9ACTN|nr:hypothetical protein [Kribbella amoyensis]TWD82223.1 hypothetical protein FB561_3351 [Kribbella amoyensis]
MFALEGLEEALGTLGAVLRSRRTESRILVVGGSSLLLLGVVDRPTADLHVAGLAIEGGYVKAERIPPPLAEAVRDVGAALGLPDGWLNNGPASLFDFGLPDGYEQRVTVRRYGALEVHVAGRLDMLCFKLYAAVDHSGYRTSKHFDDLRALAPNGEELLTEARWTRTHDSSDAFRGELVKILASLGLEVSDGQV